MSQFEIQSPPSRLLTQAKTENRIDEGPSICPLLQRPFTTTMSAKYHALANAAQQAVKQRMVPTGARSWSRALPSLEVSFFSRSNQAGYT